MQLQLPLVTFEYEHHQKIRTVTIDNEPWFYAVDICRALEIANSRDAVSKLDDDDVGKTDGVDSLGKRAAFTVVNESGLYNLVFQSRKPEAKKFKRWITHEVIPQLRKSGVYSLGRPVGTPAFVRRFNDNWSRVAPGYFSVISELFIRVYGRFEQVGHVLREQSPKGTEIRPDVSVGRLFSDWLKKYHPERVERRRTYSHVLSDGREVDAFQYPLDLLPLFIEYVEGVWLIDHAPDYLEARDSTALQFLPKLLPDINRKKLGLKI